MDALAELRLQIEWGPTKRWKTRRWTPGLRRAGWERGRKGRWAGG